MRLVPTNYISDEDLALQHILDSYPVLKYRLTLLLNGYRELCTMALEAMLGGERDTADGWRSLAKKDTATRRLGIPLLETMQAWTEVTTQLEHFRDFEQVQQDIQETISRIGTLNDDEEERG